MTSNNNEPAAIMAANADAGSVAAVTDTKAEQPVMTRKPVKLLVFDMGHVFVKFDWSRLCEAFCERAKVSNETFKNVLLEVSKLGYERGHCNTETFLRKLNELLNANISMAEFDKLWNVTFEEDPDMAALLQSLGKRYPLYLLSNTNENHYGFLQGNFNVARHFKKLILSYEVGFAKPDAEIYDLVMQWSGYAADECVFVDDLLPNIEAARKAGLNAIQFVGIEDLKQRLKKDYGVDS